MKCKQPMITGIVSKDLRVFDLVKIVRQQFRRLYLVQQILKDLGKTRREFLFVLYMGRHQNTVERINGTEKFLMVCQISTFKINVGPCIK